MPKVSKGHNSRKKIRINQVIYSHTCHKLWTKICEIRQKFKRDLTKFCEIFLNITLELPQYSLKSLLLCKKLVKTTTVCDLWLFLHKISRKMVCKFYEIWIFLWELPSRWAKFCEILSHSMRYSMYVIILYQLIKVQGNGLSNFQDILLTRLKCQNFQRTVTQENKFDFFFLIVNQVIYSSFPISLSSFKAIAQTDFDISCLQG